MAKKDEISSVPADIISSKIYLIKGKESNAG
jgi:hypothetical protein